MRAMGPFCESLYFCILLVLFCLKLSFLGRCWYENVYTKKDVVDGLSCGNKAFAIVQTMLLCTTPATPKPRNFHDEVYAVKVQLHEIWLAAQPAEEEEEDNTP